MSTGYPVISQARQEDSRIVAPGAGEPPARPCPCPIHPNGRHKMQNEDHFFDVDDTTTGARVNFG